MNPIELGYYCEDMDCTRCEYKKECENFMEAAKNLNIGEISPNQFYWLSLCEV